MEIKNIKQRIPAWIWKYRYPILILLIGVILFFIPQRQEDVQAPIQEAIISQQPDITQQLTQILGQIEGVGKVKIMLTIAAGESIQYHYDKDVNTDGNSSTIHHETVIITDSERNQQALITQTFPPKYQGAIVVCQGADQPVIKLAIVDAISKATGLGADQISVLKMK